MLSHRLLELNPSTYITHCLLAVALVACCSLLTARAQSATATLSGTIVDQNGAVVPGVLVTISNKGTAAQRQVTTSEDGSFVVPLLPPSTYLINTRRDGFSPVEVRDVVLNVGDRKSLQIQLKAGDVNAQVTIDSDAETVRTDGSVGTVVDRQFVANIPLNGRSLQALIQLTPGVVLTPTFTGSTNTGQFSVNGQRTISNYYMVDGVSANTGIGASSTGDSQAGTTPGTTALGGTNSLVSLDALQEFRIDTSTFAAEFGRTPGGQISLLTRSGTNVFHGSASEYFRNEALDANDWFANSLRQPKPNERQNLFGGVLGGPLYLPRFGEGGPSCFGGKDRLFFFASYEGLRLEQPKVIATTVPSTALRTQAVPALRPYLNAFPIPNGRNFANGSAEFAASYSDSGEFNVFALRLDARIRSSLTSFFRFSQAPSQTKSRVLSLSTVQSLNVDNNVFTGGLTWIPTSRLNIELRGNWTRNQPKMFRELDTFGGAIVPTASEVFLPGRDPSQSRFQFGAVNSFFGWGANGDDVQRQFNVIGTVGGLVGSHQLKVGVDYRRLLPLFGGGLGAFENIRFTTAQQLISGLAPSYQITNTDTDRRKAIIENLSLFAQDAWHVNRRLTLTYGLRFERVPPPTEASGRLPRTVLGIENEVLVNPRLAPEGTSLWHSRVGEFAPRFGLAYQLGTRSGWETTIRGGTGIFYDLGLGSIANAFDITYPFFASKTVRNTPFPISPAVRTPPVLGIDPPSQLNLMDPNLRLPYTLEWNGTLEQGIGKDQVITLGYVGASSRRLIILQDYFQPLAEWPTTETTLVIQRNLGRSNYKSLQLQYNRRLHRGIQALASYTLASSRDNTSLGDTIAPAASLGALVEEYGPSDFDVRHVISTAITYDVPKFLGPAFSRALFNSWGLDLLVRYQSAFPASPEAGIVFANDVFYIPRPDLVPGQPLYLKDPALPGGRTFNLAAFTFPAENQQGNFPRNGLRAFPASQVDLALRREFKLRERIRLQLRAEVFNLFNHPNFGRPTVDITDPLFGKPIQMLNGSLGGLNALYQMGGPRSGQLALKILF